MGTADATGSPPGVATTAVGGAADRIAGATVRAADITSVQRIGFIRIPPGGSKLPWFSIGHSSGSTRVFRFVVITFTTPSRDSPRRPFWAKGGPDFPVPFIQLLQIAP